jgi:hypothetical protein
VSLINTNIILHRTSDNPKLGVKILTITNSCHTSLKPILQVHESMFF